MKVKAKTNETIVVEFTLTESEKLAYSKELCEAISKKRQSEDQLKAFQTRKKAEIAQVDAVINRLSETINNVREFRDVKCEIVKDFDKKVKYYYDISTGEQVKISALSSFDIQMEIDFKNENEIIEE